MDEPTVTTEDAATDASEAATTEPQPPKEEDYRGKWEGQRKVNRDLEAKLSRALAEAESLREQAMPPEERARLKAERDANARALDLFREKVAAANLRAAAVGRLADPSDATVFIAAGEIPVDDDGNVDMDTISARITELVEKKPHLAARSEPARVEGSADGGARKTPTQPSLDEQIREAQANGDWRTVIHLQTQKIASKAV